MNSPKIWAMDERRWNSYWGNKVQFSLRKAKKRKDMTVDRKQCGVWRGFLWSASVSSENKATCMQVFSQNRTTMIKKERNNNKKERNNFMHSGYWVGNNLEDEYKGGHALDQPCAYCKTWSDEWWPNTFKYGTECVILCLSVSVYNSSQKLTSVVL